MKRIVSAFITVIALALVSAWAGDNPKEVPRIQVERTTKSDVRNICGEPARSQENTAGEEWRYLYGEADSLTVTFNKEGIVKDFRYQTVKPMSQKAKSQNRPAFRMTAGEKPGTVHCDLCPIYCTRTICDLNGCRSEQYICQWYSCNCGGY